MSSKKAEMVRRSKVVAFIGAYDEVYDLLQNGEADPKYIEAFGYLLDKLRETFDVEPAEYKIER